MAILTVGIDLAKNVFAVHGVNDAGKAELKRPAVPRAKLLELVAALPPCRIGMEACSGAHHWARQFAAFGHDVRLMAPKFVAPYRLSGRRAKNDAADAAAICEAVTRPNMLFVPVKSEDQQQHLMAKRATTAGRQARAGENVPRTARPGLVGLTVPAPTELPENGRRRRVDPSGRVGSCSPGADACASPASSVQIR